MASDFLERLKEDILVTHGGIGTMLWTLGYSMKESLTKWIVDHPDTTGRSSATVFNETRFISLFLKQAGLSL